MVMKGCGGKGDSNVFLFTFAQSSGVTCLATKEWVDLISGKSDIAASVCNSSRLNLGKTVDVRFLKGPDWVWLLNRPITKIDGTIAFA